MDPRPDRDRQRERESKKENKEMIGIHNEEYREKQEKTSFQ